MFFLITIFFNSVAKFLPIIIKVIISFVISGIILNLLVSPNWENFLYSIKDPIYSLDYLKRYIKWWYENREIIELKHSLYLFFSVSAPYFAFLLAKELYKNGFLRVFIGKIIHFKNKLVAPIAKNSKFFTRVFSYSDKPPIRNNILDEVADNPMIDEAEQKKIQERKKMSELIQILSPEEQKMLIIKQQEQMAQMKQHILQEHMMNNVIPHVQNTQTNQQNTTPVIHNSPPQSQENIDISTAIIPVTQTQEESNQQNSTSNENKQ